MESPRPMLAIPHLLNQESAASYQGYLLAHMAVYQTRAFFLRQHGYLTDNAAIGPALAAHYWAPGNSVDHDATLRSLTGEGFSARYLADECNRSVDEAWTEARRGHGRGGDAPVLRRRSSVTGRAHSSGARRRSTGRFAATARTPCALASRRGFASTIRMRSIESTLLKRPRLAARE